MTTIKYLPAISSLYHIVFKYDGRVLNWWDDTSFFKYDGVLFSYYFFQTNPEMRKEIGFKGKMFFADSGGFSVVSKGASISPKDVIRWMNVNADIGVILDIPPYSFSGSSQFGGNAAMLFKKSLEKTYENSKIMYELWNKKFMLYAVMQGETYDQKVEWIDKLKSIGEFSGCGLSPKPSTNLWQIASHMLIAINKGFRNIHILQVSGNKSMSIIYYIAKLTNKFDLITFDSSTCYLLGAEYRKMINKPFSIGTTIYNEKFEGSKLPCDCITCQQVNKNISVLKQNDRNTFVGLMLSLHNLQMKLKETEILENMSLVELRGMIDNDKLIQFINICLQDLNKQKEVELEFEELCKGCDKFLRQTNLFEIA